MIQTPHRLSTAIYESDLPDEEKLALLGDIGRSLGLTRVNQLLSMQQVPAQYRIRSIYGAIQQDAQEEERRRQIDQEIDRLARAGAERSAEATAQLQRGLTEINERYLTLLRQTREGFSSLGER